MNFFMDLGAQFYYSCSYGNFEEVKNILIRTPESQRNSIINYQHDNGKTPLWITCAWGLSSTPYRPAYYFEIAEYLIKNGADINCPNNEGKTPLWMAASWGHYRIVDLLIWHGADLNVQVSYCSNFTPLQIAAYCKRSPEAFSWKYRVFSKHHAYYNALAYMKLDVMGGKNLRFFPEIMEDLRMLKSYSAVDWCVDIPDEIMDIVEKYNHFATVELLVLAQADINIPDNNGDTALQKAKLCDHFAMEKLLLENGAVMKIIVKDEICE